MMVSREDRNIPYNTVGSFTDNILDIVLLRDVERNFPAAAVAGRLLARHS